jgi:hypothetical protein
MKLNEIKVGQLVTIGTEIQWWNSDDTNVDYNSDRWAPFEVLEIGEATEDYVTLNLRLRDGIWEREIELEIEYSDLELVK